MTHPLVSRNEGRAGLHRPVAIGGVQVGVADARGLDLHQDAARRDFRDRHFLDRQRLAEGTHHRRLHGLRHGRPPPLHRDLTVDAHTWTATRRLPSTPAPTTSPMIARVSRTAASGGNAGHHRPGQRTVARESGPDSADHHQELSPRHPQASPPRSDRARGRAGRIRSCADRALPPIRGQR